MADLYRLKALNYDLLCLVHTLADSPQDLMVEASPKIDAYIAYRLEREQEMLNILKTHSQFHSDDLFNKLYEHKNVNKDSMLRDMAKMSFNAQVDKLCRESKIEKYSDLIKYLHH